MVKENFTTLKLNASQFIKNAWYLKFMSKFYCDMINLSSFKHDAQIKAGLDISISKLNLVKFVS
jgi:hypothetical protein